MRIDIITVFPEMFRGFLGESILSRAVRAGKVFIRTVDLRDFARDQRRTVDDKPYSGGPGMLIGPAPIFEAMDDLALWDAYKIFLTPSGRPLSYGIACELSKRDHIMILCGHYEGVDQRVRDIMDEEISIGDYVISNGSVAAMVLIDTVTRLIPGTLGNEDSAENDSFCDGLLEYPQYTRPEEYRGMRVPDVLLSGNHQLIAKWRREKQLELTKLRRPELLEKAQKEE